MWVSFGFRTGCLPIFIIIVLVIAGGYFFYEKITGQDEVISIKSLVTSNTEKQSSSVENENNSNTFLRKGREDFFKN